ncbi:phage minor head protein [Mesoterricola silvestris]|uniref:Phage head morphogenesis domain-containing protein n=1 Tax=Mesoterricola silvestris TaxID=2927979 RepID=A0AA48GXX0_9BACT|nr:phage minor head protein [Mesoterricola silvestris]BDU72388.1 hypothetical protein METEAL_15620 [Mesoterricola silvestris]
MTPPIPDKIRSNLISLMVDTTRYEAGLAAKIDRMILQLGQDLIRDLVGSGLDTPRTDWQKSRLRSLLAQAQKTIETGYGDIASFQSDEMTGLIRVSGKGVVTAVNAAMGADIMIPPKWTPELLRSLADGSLIQGAPSADWWARQGADLTNAFADQMRQGVLRGETITQLRDRILGQNLPGVNAAGKVDLRTVQPALRAPIYTARRNAEALVRSSVISMSSAAHHAAYEANSDIMAGETWTATLDISTCPRCGALDSVTFPWGSEHPTPALHFGCRCFLTPQTKSWQQLAREAHGNSTLAKELDNIPEGDRASMDGPVSGKFTYQNWFDAQPKARQVEILGDRKLELYQKGKLSFADMINQKGNPLTIKQLEEMYS